MRRPPEERKPASGKTGSLKIDRLFGPDAIDDTRAINDRQARKIRRRFTLSWPVARLIAELAFERSA
jgi:hypothetical protein